MAAWHDGEVSEASFVLVKKRLKVKMPKKNINLIFAPKFQVAWEHRQLQQMRKLSLMRRESAGLAKETNMTHSMVNILEATKRNNWIPEISQVDE
jgi:hypothetical protein